MQGGVRRCQRWERPLEGAPSAHNPTCRQQPAGRCAAHSRGGSDAAYTRHCVPGPQRSHACGNRFAHRLQPCRAGEARPAHSADLAGGPPPARCAPPSPPSACTCAAASRPSPARRCRPRPPAEPGQGSRRGVFSTTTITSRCTARLHAMLSSCLRPAWAGTRPRRPCHRLIPAGSRLGMQACGCSTHLDGQHRASVVVRAPQQPPQLPGLQGAVQRVADACRLCRHLCRGAALALALALHAPQAAAERFACTRRACVAHRRCSWAPQA